MEFRCPWCNRKAEVIWHSKDGKTVAIRCEHPHEYGKEKGYIYWDDKEFTFKHVPPKPRFVSGLIFLLEVSK